MKKTLITLLALSGLALAANDTLNTELQNQLTTLNYQNGDAFTVALTDITTLGSTAFDKLLDLTSTVNLHNQYAHFISINSGTTSNDWLSADNYTVNTEKKTASITLDATALDNKGYWFAGRFDGDGNFYANGNATPSMISALVVSYDTDKTTKITVTRADATATILTITNLELNANNLSFYHSGTAGALTVTVAPTSTVPEPTTATLSLLALAGLAARRRRS